MEILEMKLKKMNDDELKELEKKIKSRRYDNFIERVNISEDEICKFLQVDVSFESSDGYISDGDNFYPESDFDSLMIEIYDDYQNNTIEIFNKYLKQFGDYRLIDNCPVQLLNDNCNCFIYIFESNLPYDVYLELKDN